MRTIFLADAHLKAPTDPNYRLLLRFLDSLKGNTETLFIMGDLFDFWVGFPSHPFRQYDAVLEGLLDLTRNGCRIVYFEGNHDFHLGTIFSKHLKAEIYRGPAVMTVQGKRLFLCHGDQINREDRGYRLLRFLLHNKLVASAVRHFPPSLALKVKERLQRTSQSGYHAKRERWNYREIILTFARSVQQQGYDGLVTGHFHLALREELAPTPFTVLSLGDWMEQFTYGEMRDGELRLHTYRP